VPGVAWWKTFLVHVFVGSGLLVFSLPKNKGTKGHRDKGTKG
jgi:hypothetical protein